MSRRCFGSQRVFLGAFSRRACGAALTAVGLSLVATTAFGHVAFDGLESGQVFEAGSTVELQWKDTIPHETTAYELWFIPAEGAEPVEIAVDIPSTEHSLSWQVPETPCDDCALYVLQVNVGSDYSQTHPIVIVTDAAEIADAGAEDREIMGMHLPTEPAEDVEAMGGAAAIGEEGEDANAVGGASTADQDLEGMDGDGAETESEPSAPEPSATEPQTPEQGMESAGGAGLIGQDAEMGSSAVPDGMTEESAGDAPAGTSSSGENADCTVAQVGKGTVGSWWGGLLLSMGLLLAARRPNRR